MKRKVVYALALLLVGYWLGLRAKEPIVVAEVGQGGASPCGDVNGDGKIDLSDAVTILNFLFTGGTPPVCPPTECINLVLKPFDCANITVACPGGGGTCVTTVNFSIENTGSASVGPFTIHVEMDPSVVVDKIVPSLPPGITLFSISSPPGGNCYDSDCSILVRIDSANVIAETDETDNKIEFECLG